MSYAYSEGSSKQLASKGDEDARTYQSRQPGIETDSSEESDRSSEHVPGHRSVRVTVYGLKQESEIVRIWIDGKSTYGDIREGLAHLHDVQAITVLQAVYGRRPYWMESRSESIIEPTCVHLYAVIVTDRYTLSVVRTALSDYPIALFDSMNSPAMAVSQKIVTAQPSLTNRIKSITGYSSKRGMSDDEYNYELLREHEEPNFPTVFFIMVDEVPGSFMVNASDDSIPPFLQIQFVQCRDLLQRAYNLELLPLQAIHVSRAIHHLVISLAKALGGGFSEKDSSVSDDLTEKDNLADLIRVAPVIAGNLQSILNTFGAAVKALEEKSVDPNALMADIRNILSALCGDYHGAVVVRHSFEAFERLVRMDRDEIPVSVGNDDNVRPVVSGLTDRIKPVGGIHPFFRNQSLGPNLTLGSYSSVRSTKQAHSFDSGSVSVSSVHETDAEKTVELHNSNNDTSLAEGGGVSATLDKLMIDYVPRDLSGQVVIPDRGIPAQGGLADVHFGLFDKKEVAVKVLRMKKIRWRDQGFGASNERRIRREMHVWSALKHRNICEFLGYSMDFGDYPAMILMWCHRGTAYDYLGSQELSVKERIRLALDVTEGLCYLHDLKIIHGDVKPSNVLVDDTCVGCLCDFGLVRLVDWEGPVGMTTTSPYTGTERYKAPELFPTRDNRHTVATFEGDIYSLGCVMLEFIERLYPFKRFVRADFLRDAIMDGHSPALRSETTSALSDMTDLFWDLLETCWGDPSGRPSIKEVVDGLQGFARAMPPLNADVSTLALGKRSHRVDSDTYVSFGGTQSVLRESQVKVMPKKPDESMRFENLRIPDEDGPPSEATMVKDDPLASQMTPSLSDLPESDASYSRDAKMLPPPAATLQRPSRKALISTPSSSVPRRRNLISTLKHTVMSKIRAFNSSPDFLRERNHSLSPNSTLAAHASVGSTKQAPPFDSTSVPGSSAHRTDAEETVESHNPNNDISLAQGDGARATLEKLMMDYVLCDLSGQVAIPDHGNLALGGLADVYFGLFDKKEVAVKVLRIRKSRPAEPEWEASNERRIKREMHVWSALKHRNICEFLGYSMDFGDYPAMISTWCHRGTAYDYLESQELSVKERIRLALDVSEGLCYLHDLKIIHGDMKPSNVLVDDTCVGRLCDFGLVRLVDWEGPAGMITMSPYTGTERYKAPELFMSRDNRHPVATFEGDIYSLGCVMLEFIERLYPFKRFARPADLRNAIMDRQFPALRSETTRALSGMTGLFWNLLETCWGDPSGRPSINQVIDAMQVFTHSMPPTS